MNKIGKSIADQMALEILSVQPMESDAIKTLYEASKSEKELQEQGYEPISKDTRLMWVKKNNQQ